MIPHDMIPDALSGPLRAVGIHSGAHLAAMLAGFYILFTFGEWALRTARAHVRDHAPPTPPTPPPRDAAPFRRHPSPTPPDTETTP